jgi:hypothetical protein
MEKNYDTTGQIGPKASQPANSPWRLGRRRTPRHGAAWSPHRGHTHDGALANDVVVTGSPSHLHHEHGVQARVSLRRQGSMKVAMVFGGPPGTHCRRPRSAHHLTLKCRMVGPPRRRCRRPGSAHHLTQRHHVADPLGGTVGDPGAPTT